MMKFSIYGKIKIMFQTTNQYIYIYTYIHIGSSHFSEPPLSFAKTRCLPDTTPPSDAWNSARKSERFSGGKVFRAWESVVKPMLYMVWLVVDLPLWNIWKSMRRIIPNIWKNKSHVPNHQPANPLHGESMQFMAYFHGLFPWVVDDLSSWNVPATMANLRYLTHPQRLFRTSV